ncbi:hypothetical protein [Luteococcus sp. OSA5]|uniref:hypothetical protein n=1 Tax=Luteococcus sp. OSA5 TaxID=3401630 RepID=UPI003B42F9AE
MTSDGVGPQPTPDSRPTPRGTVPRQVYLRRRLLVAGAGAAALYGAGSAVKALIGGDLVPEDLGPGPSAYCAAESALERHSAIATARLVYEVDHRATSMRFDPGFHAQLEAWLREWNSTSAWGEVDELCSQGAHVAKDDCRSWHAAGRALDFARLRRGGRELVSCRTDLWPADDPVRRSELARRYWRLAASLNLHFDHVLTHHFDAAHDNHIHVDNGRSGDGMSTFRRTSRVQNQSVQAICLSLWGRSGEVTGRWRDTRGLVSPVLDQLGLDDLRDQSQWQAFLRASMQRA